MVKSVLRVVGLMCIVEPEKGAHISAVAEEVVSRVELLGLPHMFEFSGFEYIIHSGTTAEEFLERWDEAQRDRAKCL